MTFDYPALRALSLVVTTGSFERASAALHITPSAVSQRIKGLEERLGIVLVDRGTPCTATDAGEKLCRHVEAVGLLEGNLLTRLPGLLAGTAHSEPATIHIATSADSLGTWFLPALAAYADASGLLFQIEADDQDHTADWLRRGRVMAAVTSLEQPVQGCRVHRLGALNYIPTASPDFFRKHFAKGIDAESLSAAPALTFNRKDLLQVQWAAKHAGRPVALRSHWIPSTQGFVDACLAGMGWGLNPASLVADHLRHGRLIDLSPGASHTVPLFWQINRLVADSLSGLSDTILVVARSRLIQPGNSAPR